MGKRFPGQAPGRVAKRLRERLRALAGGDDRGQTAVEYLGIIAVVVAIVLVLTRTDFGSQIASAISNQIGRVTGG
ncbi:hypothetical protein ACFP1Z_01850 [Streptomyces gamaensis]|uniref:Flp family type IVb pilin n=1 Tax=Streptomyces gamaensis TaxID=1763542 RepID=A0ABW0YVT8_9ACTN